jgi:signal transduction histidine kinase
MLDEITRLVRKEAEWRKVAVETAIEGDDPTIDADVESIRAALLNLVLNAFEAMPDGGTLALVVRREGDEAVVEVRDTGVGIPEDQRDRVFDFAYSTRDGGSGLGLAIVHQCVVEDHGGRISLDSEVGRGTTITLRLPDADDDVGVSDPPEPPEMPA